MNTETYNKLLDEMLDRTREVMGSKSAEYVRGDDKLHNFRRAAEIMRCSETEAWQGMWMKHVVSILDQLDDLKDGKSHPLALWQEKLGDARNYLFLLEAILTDDEIVDKFMVDSLVKQKQEEGFVVYIAGPYRDSRGPYFVGKNIENARQTAADLANLEISFICPHMNSAHMDGLATDTYWLAAGIHLLRRCDAVVICDGWRKSQGTRNEIKTAESLDIPLFYWPQARDELVKLHREETNPQTKGATSREDAHEDEDQAIRAAARKILWERLRRICVDDPIGHLDATNNIESQLDQIVRDLKAEKANPKTK